MKDKIFYVDSSVVSKLIRKNNPYFVMVNVQKSVGFGKVKVNCYWFDIPCAYSPVNLIGTDIVEEKCIKELNWDNLINDVSKKGYSSTKYWIWWFLQRYYDYTAGNQFIGSTLTDIYHKDELIATIDENDFKHYDDKVIKEIDIVLDDMIRHGIECANCLELKAIIRTKEIRMTPEEELIKKGIIKNP